MTAGSLADAQAATRLAREAQGMRDAGDLDGAVLSQAQAVARWRLAADRPALAHALRHLGDIAGERGDLEPAGAALAEAAAIYRAEADAPPLDVANAMRSLAIHAERCGDVEGTVARWREAEALYAAIDHQFRALGLPENPGVAEARDRLRRLNA